MWVAAAAMALGGAVIGGIVWREASQHRRLPCPCWLAWMLENPYTAAVAGSLTLLDRAGVEAGMRVLDVGAGPGRVAIPAAERVGPLGEVVAVDVQQAMLDQLRIRAGARGLQNVRAVCGAFESMSNPADVAPSSFDRALLVTVLGEIPDRGNALKTIHDALREGGVLSVTEFLPDPHFMSRASVGAPRRVRRLPVRSRIRLACRFHHKLQEASVILTYVPYIEQPSISLGPITIHAFGVIVAAAVLAGLKIGERRFGTLGLNRELGERMAWWAIVGGFLGAHLFSVIFYFPRSSRKIRSSCSCRSR